MKRITPEMVIEAYEAVGIKPICRGWFSFKNEITFGPAINSVWCGCPVTALAMHLQLSQGFGLPNARSLEMQWIVERHLRESESDVDEFADTQCYVSHFVSGFDNSSTVPEVTQQHQGYKDGEAVRVAVADKFYKPLGIGDVPSCGLAAVNGAKGIYDFTTVANDT